MFGVYRPRTGTPEAALMAKPFGLEGAKRGDRLGGGDLRLARKLAPRPLGAGGLQQHLEDCDTGAAAEQAVGKVVEVHTVQCFRHMSDLFDSCPYALATRSPGSQHRGGGSSR